MIDGRIVFILTEHDNLDHAQASDSLVVVAETQPSGQKDLIFYWQGVRDDNICITFESKQVNLISYGDEASHDAGNNNPGLGLLRKELRLMVDGAEVVCATDGPRVNIRGKWLALRWVNFPVMPSWK